MNCVCGGLGGVVCLYGGYICGVYMVSMLG